MYREVIRLILLYKELIKQYKSDYEIKQLIKEGKIFKIERGVYSDNNNVNYLDIVCMSVRKRFLQKTFYV